MSYFLLEQIEARVGKTNVRLDDYYGAGVESFFVEYRGYYVTWDWGTMAIARKEGFDRWANSAIDHPEPVGTIEELDVILDRLDKGVP